MQMPVTDKAGLRPGRDASVLGALALALGACGGDGGSGEAPYGQASPLALVSAASAAPARSRPAAASSTYSVVSARSFGVRCDGRSNDTAALQRALDSLRPRQALQLPAGTCLYSRQLVLRGKNAVTIFGAGKDATILSAADPLHSSFILTGCSRVVLRSFQVTSPRSGGRTSDASSRGFYVERSSGVTLDRIKATRVAGAGILFHQVADSSVIGSDVVASRADAFHFTGGSANILVRNNRASGAGDDCFASVGYGAEINRNIRFLDNACSDNRGSGITFEGTSGGQAWRNRLTRTGVAAMRVASAGDWNTGPADRIELRDNVLTDVKTRGDVDHPAVLVYSSRARVTNVRISGTRIISPRAETPVRVIDYQGPGRTISGITVSGTRVTGRGRRGPCIGRVNTSVAASGNTLNGAAC